MTRVRIRGIYATALTSAILEAEESVEVVQPSPPIRARFDRDFDATLADVTVEMTSDRQGIEITGTHDGVSTIRSLVDDLAIDTFSWTDVAAQDAVFAGTVVETKGSGAIVELEGDRTGFLPFGAVDGYVEVGDTVTAQVHEARPPWGRGRPELDGAMRVTGDVVTLVEGADSLVVDTPDGSPDHELVRTTDLLSTTVPDDWGIEWEWGAEDVDIATLDEALGDAVESAEALGSSLEDDADGPLLASPKRTDWVWFGRQARFVLDDHRRSAAPTLDGHHRIKATSNSAGNAVDFAEHLCPDGQSFPFEAVVTQFGPDEGDHVTIGHGKPDGRYFRLGRGTVVERDVGKRRITVERTMTGGGTYDALEVPRETGDIATTRFTEGRWWYPTVYRNEEGEVKGTYVNVSTPVEIFPETVRYVDLHVDVIKHADGTVEVVDADELQDSVDAGNVSPALQQKAMDVAEQLESAFGD